MGRAIRIAAITKIDFIFVLSACFRTDIFLRLLFALTFALKYDTIAIDVFNLFLI